MPVTITFTADTAAAAAEDLKTFVMALAPVPRLVSDDDADYAGAMSGPGPLMPLGGIDRGATPFWGSPADAAEPTMPTVEEAEPIAEADVVDFPKRGRGRPKKQVDIEAVANPEPAPEPARTHDPVETTMAGIDALTAPEPEKVPDIEEVRAWVKKVLDRRGGAAVEPLFKDFLKADGSMARKVSEIQEHDRVAIIGRAKEALGE